MIWSSLQSRCQHAAGKLEKDRGKQKNITATHRLAIESSKPSRSFRHHFFLVVDSMPTAAPGPYVHDRAQAGSQVLGRSLRCCHHRRNTMRQFRCPGEFWTAWLCSRSSCQRSTFPIGTRRYTDGESKPRVRQQCLTTSLAHSSDI